MIWRIFLLVVASTLLCNAYAYDPEDMVIAKQGSMPLIFTVPHDGADTLGWISTRRKGATVRDVGTRDLAERTANLIEQRTGARPYLVVAKFSRKYLDANRAEQDALESSDAIPAYRAYHNHIARFVAEVSERFPSGALLIDVHGQSDDPNTIFRGTRNGLTVTSLIKKHGNAAVQGQDSIIGALQGKGYQVFPTMETESLKEDSRFNGGYTVFAYGSNATNGIDAIQIEFGRRSRENSRLPEDFADAILVFMKKYRVLSK